MSVSATVKEFIILGDERVEYEVKPGRRAYSVRLTLYPHRGLVVTKGKRVRREFMQSFIKERADWILATTAEFKKLPKDVTTDFTPAEINEYKKVALSIAENRLAYFNTIYGLVYGRIGVRDQKTRWGSCSPKGNLQFNYRLALVPQHLADYVIVHELCHIAQMNHSPAFWKLVAKTIPDYVARRKELRNAPLRLLEGQSSGTIYV